MDRGRQAIWLIGIIVLVFSNLCWAQEDAKGCRDHPMFTRLPNYYQVEFMDEKGNEIEVEGRVHSADYWIKEGFKAPSDLQVLRNFQNAIKKIGGKVVKQGKSETYLKLRKAGKTYWVIVDTTNDGEHYELTIVEKADMVQEVVADAKSLMNAIQTTGHASIYGIYFDFNKADIKPESEPALKKIARLLRQNPDLKLYVVGHTDSAGRLEYNMKLSKARANAVMNELTTKYKISAGRLKAYGVGPLAPVASNKTDEGRAKNRRVELVEQ
ncbi:MAG: OmpA family protein [Deltaproteobacteria bacterium]|nr:OmpA family protein [Deltaproteobacteria bacterium]